MKVKTSLATGAAARLGMSPKLASKYMAELEAQLGTQLGARLRAEQLRILLALVVLGVCAKLAMDRKVSGPLIGPSAWFMKSPPEQFTDEEARLRTERFIEGGDAPRPPRLVS